MDKIEELVNIIKNSKYAVFFGGAGVSTESGIPDFRSVDGLYNQKYKFPPEVILSHDFFVNQTKDFYDFYREKMITVNALPNDCHKALAMLESAGIIKAVVTQNIDGLHQKAGSKVVYELHGSTLRNYCTRCGKFYSVDKIIESTAVPHCECGGVIKPDVVLYGEALNDDVVVSAISAIERADTLIVAGTSLTVYPAAGFLNYFRGKNLVLINRAETAFDNRADVILRENVGEVFKKVWDKIERS